MADDKVNVLFVCLGNICRSTMGEGVLRSMVKKEPYTGLTDRIDSCGTGAYHIGDEPDSRTMSTLEDHGVTDYSHAARKIQIEDFDTFDYIFAMDRQNLRDIIDLHKRRKHEGKAKVSLFGKWSDVKGNGKEEVNDPYYGGRDGFETAYEQCVKFSKNFLEELKKEKGSL